MPEIDAQFPDKLQCLFQPKRFKTLWGGRGGAKSWGVARALLLLGTQTPDRNLCAREFQNSIGDSVHKLICDQIDALKLNYFYEVQRDKIFSRPGMFPGPNDQTSFSFEGIKNNATRIKSYEGIKRCWVEEANKVSRGSWEVLIPTIRAENSEIWMTLNPELKTDYTYQRFILRPTGEVLRTEPGFTETSEAFIVKMSWQDNPWFPEVLHREMEDMKLRDYDAYLNIWEGQCREQLEGAVYAKELRRTAAENRICRVPWDRQTPVDAFWDLGRADRTAIWFAQRVAMQYRIVGYFEDSQEEIHYYLRHLQSREWTYGTLWLPHDAKAKRLGSKRTIEEIVRSHAGWNVRIVPKLSLVDGINAVRIIFPNCWFDESECEDGLERLRHYRYRIVEGQFSNEPLHDDASDGADAFRYLAIAMKQPGRNNRLSMSERLMELTRAVQRGREEEFSGDSRRGGRASNVGWMGH